MALRLIEEAKFEVWKCRPRASPIYVRRRARLCTMVWGSTSRQEGFRYFDADVRAFEGIVAVGDKTLQEASRQGEGNVEPYEG